MNCFRTTKSFYGSRPLLFVHGDYQPNSNYSQTDWMLLTEHPEVATKVDTIRGRGVPLAYPDQEMNWSRIFESMIFEQAGRHFAETFEKAFGLELLDLERSGREVEFEPFQEWPTRLYPIVMRGSNHILEQVAKFMNRLPKSGREFDFMYDCVDLRESRAKPIQVGDEDLDA